MSDQTVREEEVGNDFHAWLTSQYPDFDADTSGEDSADIVDHLKVLFRRALSLSESAPQKDREWQPIETAPKNQRVLIGGGGCPRVHENELRCFRTAGCGWAGLGTEEQPTHWMPLPKPPQEAKHG